MASFTYKILNKKMEAFKINVRVTEEASEIIDIFSEGSSGYSQIILSMILVSLKNKIQRNIDDVIIKDHDIIYSLVENHYFNNYFLEQQWERQKTKNDKGYPINLVDTRDYWNDICTYKNT